MTQARYYSSTAVSTTVTDNPLGSGATTMHVASTSGFPVSYPYTLILDPDTASEEVVDVTAATGLALTITRGVDGTAAVQHSFGAPVKHGVSARDYTDLQAHIAAATAVHGLTGSVVGTSDTQTLTNKTLASPTFSGTISGLATLASIITTYPALSWTPTYVGITGTTEFSRAVRIGGLVFCQATVNVTSTTGSIGINLPTTPATNVGYQQVIGSAEYRSTANAITTYGLAVPSGGAAFMYSGGGGGGEVFAPGWTSGTISFGFFYFDA